MEMTFRSAAFGGFNRQDVTDYITNTAKETGEQIAALEKERDQLQADLAAKESLEQEVAGLREQCAQLKADVETKTSEIETLKCQAEERDDLARRVSELEGQADEYCELKQHIAGIELDAHRRADQLLEESRRKADDIVSKANEDATRIRKQAEQMLQELCQQYEEQVRALEVAAGHVTGELRKMDVAVGQLPLAFNRLSAGLRDLKEQTLGETRE